MPTASQAKRHILHMKATFASCGSKALIEEILIPKYYTRCTCSLYAMLKNMSKLCALILLKHALLYGHQHTEFYYTRQATEISKKQVRKNSGMEDKNEKRNVLDFLADCAERVRRHLLNHTF